ncbi:MAG: flagellar biosynthetic protein FliR [Butyricicoccus sp.]|nr:flagellar biosynthetic protein FliR [Butyricicoccus sp.]
MFDWSELTLFIYVLSRMSGFVFFSPIFGRNNIPVIYRTGFSLVLSVSAISAIATRQTVATPVSLVDLAIRILLELAIGFLFSMVMQFFFYIPQLAGTLIDTQMGMTMNQIYDPASQANLSATGVFLNAFMMLLFFAENGHHTLLRIIITSGEVVPYGTIVFGTDVAEAMLQLFINCTLLAVKLTLPILGAELLGQIGMGVLMKVIPQINVFAINIELKVIIGLGLLLALLSPISEYLLTVEIEMLKSLEEILKLAAG